MLQPRRRVVTGHNAAGKSCIQSDETFGPGSPNVLNPAGEPELSITGMWRLEDNPSPHAPDLVMGEKLNLKPPVGGNFFIVAQIPPSSRRNPESQKAIHESLPTTPKEPGQDPRMHRTVSVDYLVVISGKIDLIMDEGQTTLYPGDVIIQRGTNHAWDNPYDEPCVYLSIVFDGSLGAGPEY